MDSSSDEGDDYLVTNVTLGYVSTKPTTDEVSHVGGYSDWLDAEITPSAKFAKCRVCNGFMSLLLQLHADLQTQFPNDERRLHLLYCRKRTCSRKIGSVRAFREVRKPVTRSKSKPADQAKVQDPKPSSTGRELGNTLFGSTQTSQAQTSSNPFSMNSGSTPSSNIFASLPPISSLAAVPSQTPTDEIQPPSETFAQKLKISSPTIQPSDHDSEPWPSQTDLSAPFKFFHLDADSEELEPNPSKLTDPSGPSSAPQLDLDDPSSSSTIPDKDNFESSIDKTFQKFSDRIAQNPDQILRYEFKGQPLLYSGHDDVASRFIVPHGKAGAIRGIPRCEACGNERVFELQLVPGLIYELEKDDSTTTTLDDGMEWGTIIVGVCSKNCGETGTVIFREEWVGVQWEERIVKP